MSTKVRKLNRRFLSPVILTILFSPAYNIQASDVVEAKKSNKAYAEQGIFELSGSASGSYRMDGRGGSATLSPGISYFLMPNWFLGAGLSLRYSNFDPDPKNVDPNSRVQWFLSYLPTVEFGYAKAFTTSWYWSVAGGYGYYDAVDYQNNGPYFYNQFYANFTVKHAIGDCALLNIGVKIDTQSIGNLFLGFSVYF